MEFSFTTSAQMRAQLRALRMSKNLTQAQLGQLLGVSQKRIARIESAPQRTSLDQIVRLLSALGSRLTVSAIVETKTPGKADW